MSKSREYLDFMMTVKKVGGWSKDDMEDFINEFKELVYNFNAECDGDYELLSHEEFYEGERNID